MEISYVLFVLSSTKFIFYVCYYFCTVFYCQINKSKKIQTICLVDKNISKIYILLVAIFNFKMAAWIQLTLCNYWCPYWITFLIK